MIIRKARKVSGMGINLRNAVPNDAAFILSLRTDERLNQHISPVSGDLADQITFMERYAEKSDEAFFVIEGSEGEQLGTVRLYDRQGDSFCWGSWIVKQGAPARTGTKSAMLVYIYAFEHLGFTASHFDVRQANVNVWRFHEKTGARLIGETDIDRFYQFPREQWVKTRAHYQVLIGNEPVIIEELA